MFVVGLNGFVVLCQPLLGLFRPQGIGQSLLKFAVKLVLS
jgi:hypothetical protein